MDYEYNVRHPHQEKIYSLACPFFMPVRKLEDGGWLHPSRLPLGGGWHGHCSAPGYEGVEPSQRELMDLCNLGYASRCSRLPVDRSCDAVRFSIARDCGSQLLVFFACEMAHRPAGHGTLEYDLSRGQWMSSHPDARIQMLAECYLQSYLPRRTQSAAPKLTSSTKL
jgi:hypothetical protein